jgi:hypothetical protein
MRNADYRAHPLRPCIRFRMTQKPTHENSDLFFPHRETNQAVSRMTESPVIETPVPREKRCITKCVQKRDDFLIFHPLSSNINTQLMSWNPPPQQQSALVFSNVFIEEVHVGVGSKTNSSLCLKNASLDNLTASAIASLVMLLCHCSMIVSQAIPSATISRTSETKMRVPRKTGFP